MLVKAAFDAEHYFLLEHICDNHTRLIHGGTFTGILATLMRKALEKTKEEFLRMNIALKTEREGSVQ